MGAVCFCQESTVVCCWCVRVVCLWRLGFPCSRGAACCVGTSVPHLFGCDSFFVCLPVVLLLLVSKTCHLAGNGQARRQVGGRVVLQICRRCWHTSLSCLQLQASAVSQSLGALSRVCGSSRVGRGTSGCLPGCSCVLADSGGDLSSQLWPCLGCILPSVLFFRRGRCFVGSMR